MNPLQHALDRVTATEEMKERTKAFLSAQRERRARPSAAPRLVLALACLLLTLLRLGGQHIYSTPVSYISIDVNPSIELALNRFDRVVGITAYNSDGAEVLDGLSLPDLSLPGKSYQEAIEALFADPGFQAYLDTGAEVVFTVVSDKEDALRAGIVGCGAFQSHDSAYYQADSHCLEQAHQNGISVGKYRVYEELSRCGSGVTLEDCHHMTIGELQRELERCGGHGNGHHAASPAPSSSPETSPAPVQTAGGDSHGHGHGGYHGGRD